MASVTKYAGTVTQTNGGPFVPFDYLNNIRNAAESSHAVSSILIQGKSETNWRSQSKCRIIPCQILITNP